MKKRVLIMDDSALVLEMVQIALEGAGFEVLIANDLAELEQRRAETVDLILLDVQMPEAFGDDVGMVLRGVRGTSTPIFLLSDLDEQELSRRVGTAEVDGYISKRAGLDALVRRVEDILGGPTS